MRYRNNTCDLKITPAIQNIVGSAITVKTAGLFRYTYKWWYKAFHDSDESPNMIKTLDKIFVKKSQHLRFKSSSSSIATAASAANNNDNNAEIHDTMNAVVADWGKSVVGNGEKLIIMK